MNKTKLMLGDNIESLKKLPDNSIDSVVTDPPYGLSFMGKKWDYDVPSVEFWKEVYRVLKPGGHILSFGGTRTYHRMVVNIEDAGFEIRDQVMWLYGSGFPKSHNIGKAVDKLEGNDREVIMKNPYADGSIRKATGQVGESNCYGDYNIIELEDGLKKDTKGTSPYEGWGTALKPANEPICVARKPLSEKTIAENVIKWGTGGINIDGCRISHNEPIKTIKAQEAENTIYNTGFGRYEDTTELKEEGRFPANLILECCCDEVIKGEKGEVKMRNKLNKHSGSSLFNTNLIGSENYDYKDKGDIHTNPMCPCRLLDEQSGVSKSSPRTTELNGNPNGVVSFAQGKNTNHNDKGGASRFFYVAKVSKKERNLGLDDNMKSIHPTVKPINLMTYLCRLITPENGIVLDPFMGSGSTGIAAQLEGFRFVGMEMDEDYFKIAEARINAYEEYRKLLK